MPTMKKVPPKLAAVAEPQPIPKQPLQLIGAGSARKDGLPKVYWRPEEHALLADTMLPLLDGDPPMSLPKALKQAQDALPAERRRSVYSTPMEVWIPAALDAARQRRAAAIAERKAAAERKEVEAAQSVREGLARLEAAKAAQEAPESVTAPTPAALSVDAPTAAIPPVPAGIALAWHNLRGLLVDELASILVEAGLKAIGSTLLQPQQIAVADEQGDKRIVFQRAPSPARKPSLLVVGLKTNWRTLIEEQFRNQFDLRFYSTDESKDALRTRVSAAETVIAMTDHISHSIYESTKHRAVNLIHQAGGVNQLRETLSGLLPRPH